MTAESATVHTFPLTGPINLSARIGHGALTVRTADGLTEARVELDAAPDVLERITVEQLGPTLRVQLPRQGGLADLLAAWRPGGTVPAGRLTATVTVPTGTALEISTVTASITVEGRSGGASIATGAGAIVLGEVDGDLTMRYGAADSSVRRVSGSVTVRSGAGNARFGDIGGNLEAGCGRGRLDVDRIKGSVRSRSGAGEARLGAVYGDVDLASGSGSVSIGLPAGVTARLDLTSGSGQVRSDLPIEKEPVTDAGAITVRARTGSGDLRLFRAA